MPNKKLTVREARAALAGDDDNRRDAVRAELEALGAAEITDILTWDSSGQVVFKGSAELTPRARKAIKRVKVTPTQHGNSVEVEMHDKLAALRLLAKHHGLLEADPNINRPTLIGINLVGPDGTLDEPTDS
tara:strand:- start:4075 stop:4467 length:393 start_codon:yes stop_codon:yes gene_type:complete